MNKKIEQAHSHISGEEVARIILDFAVEFHDVYPRDIHEGMCAVGPLQSLIGHAISKGRLRAAKDGK